MEIFEGRISPNVFYAMQTCDRCGVIVCVIVDRRESTVDEAAMECSCKYRSSEYENLVLHAEQLGLLS